MTLGTSSNKLFSNNDLKRLILPLIIEQALALGVGLADSIMVARVGESAVSAVSLVDSIMILIINVFAALATGGAVVAGQYLGQKNEEKAREGGKQLIAAVTFISVGLMILMYIGRGFITKGIFGAIDADVEGYANTYLLIVFASIPFIAMYNAGAALFRAMGNSKVTMFTSIIMSIINVAGNALLIYGFRMGVEGVAIPTLVSRMVAAIIILSLLFDSQLKIHFSRPFKYKPNKEMIGRILHIGIPNGIENSMFQLGKIMLLSVVAGFGTASITANAVANSITSFGLIPAIAIGLSLVTVVSQCVGAGDYAQVRYYTKKLLKYAYLSFVAMLLLILLILPLLFNLYNLSAETANIARTLILCHAVTACLIWPLSFSLPNTLRASNDVRYVMIVSMTSMWLFRVGFGILFAKYLNMGVLGVWIAMLVDWVVRTTFFVIRYRGSKWETIYNKE